MPPGRERIRGKAVFVVIFRTLRLILRHPFRVAVSLVLIVLQNVIELLIPIFVGQMLMDNVLLRHPIDPDRYSRLFQSRLVYWVIEPWRDAGPETLLWVAIGGLLVLSLLGYGRWLFFVWWDWTLKNLLLHSLRTRLMAHLVQMGIRFHSSQRVGDLINRVQNDSNTIVFFYQQAISAPWMHLVKLFTALGSLFMLSPKLTLIALSVVPIALVFNFFLGIKIRMSARRARECESDLISHVDNTLGSIRTVMAYGKESAEAEEYCGISKLALHWKRRLEFLQALLSRSVEETNALARFAVFAFGAYAVWRQEISIGQWGVMLAYMGRIHQPLFALTEVWSRLQTQLIGLDRVFRYLDMTPEIKDNVNAKPVRALKELEFRNVSFEYEEGLPVLQNISIKARRGTVTAFVGPVGSGKSTLACMIPRFLDPTSGNVLIDGVDIREYQIGSIRDQISFAMQENQLFPKSILQNILYGMRAPGMEDVTCIDDLDEAPRGRLLECVEAACMDEFVEKLPEGYSTHVGERAARLSGGERQRIAVARALLRDAPIIILDEPTASLDAETEEELLQNLQRLGRDKIIFIIAHRLATIRHADQICFLRNGNLLETGTHGELISMPEGNYRRFYDMQYKIKDWSKVPNPGDETEISSIIDERV